MKPGRESARPRFGFEVPNPLDAESVALEYDANGRTVSVTLPSDSVAALAEPPAEFDVTAFEVPDSVAANEIVEATVVVENVGDTDGTFRGCLNEVGPTYAPHPFELSISAGERRELTETFGSHLGSDGTSLDLSLALPRRERRRVSVAVRSETTAGADG